jgi:spore maturation protein CgeB
MNKNILFLSYPPLIANGLLWGFQQNGWNTYLMEGQDYVLGQSVDKQIPVISRYIDTYKIDVVFCEFRLGVEWQATYELCNKKGISFCCWGIEDTLEHFEWMHSTLPYCHYYFTTCEEFIPVIKKQYNRDADLLIFGVNPEFHKLTVPNKEKYPYDICLVANNYNSRSKEMKWFLEPLLKNNYNVAVYGNEWWIDNNYNFNLCKYNDKYKGLMLYHDIPELYSTIPVVLGVNCSSSSFSQLSMRPFEFGGMGYNSCMVSFYTKAQERWFGDLLYLPKNTQETFDMIKEVLEMTDEQRIEKSNVLREFVYTNHSYKDRAKIVIDRICK